MGRTYRTITDTVDIIITQKKGKHLNILEKYYIYKIGENNLHMNDTNIGTHNPVFRVFSHLATYTLPPI
jgi:hypothetical protein